MPFNANILIVDPSSARRELLERDLGMNGCRVIPVDSGAAALAAVASEMPDMVMIEISADGKDALGLAAASALVREMKKIPTAGRLLMVFVGGLPPDMDPAAVLAAGADEFLARPINDHMLLRCLMSFVRLATMQSEFNRRLATNEDFGIEANEDMQNVIEIDSTRILVVGRNEDQISKLEKVLGDWMDFVCVWSMSAALTQLKNHKFDACVVLLDSSDTDYLAFCKDIRHCAPLYSLPVLVVGDQDFLGAGLEAWQAGYTDVMIGPFNSSLLFARLMALITQEHYRARLRLAYQTAPDVKVSDSLSGLYSFGYFHAHLQREVAYAHKSDKNLSLGFFAVSDMTAINQEHGYPAGDYLLRQIGNTIGRLLRGEDLTARYGGDEFSIILPGTSSDRAQIVIKRLTSVIENTEFAVPGVFQAIKVSVRSSVAGLEPGESAEVLIAKVRARAVSYAKSRMYGAGRLVG